MHIEDLEAKPLLVTSHICHTVELELSDKFRKHCSLYHELVSLNVYIWYVAMNTLYWRVDRHQSSRMPLQHWCWTDLCVDQSYEFTIMESYNGQRRMMHCAGGDSITLLRRSY